MFKKPKTDYCYPLYETTPHYWLLFYDHAVYVLFCGSLGCGGHSTTDGKEIKHSSILSFVCDIYFLGNIHLKWWHILLFQWIIPFTGLYTTNFKQHSRGKKTRIILKFQKLKYIDWMNTTIITMKIKQYIKITVILLSKNIKILN